MDWRPYLLDYDFCDFRQARGCWMSAAALVLRFGSWHAVVALR
jgi:hypothetical protein